MSDLLRIVYISRATFDASPSQGPSSEGAEASLDQLASEIQRILLQSRENNRRAGLVGMLYFDAGHFFQCIEGERAGVEALFRKLRKDSRHRDVKLLASHRVERLSFPDWAMKYVPVDHHALQLLEQHGFDSFDPYRFDHHLVERMLHLMQGAADPTVTAIPGRPSRPARQPEGLDMPDRMEHPGAPIGLIAALVMSAAALLISIATCGYVAFAG